MIIFLQDDSPFPPLEFAQQTPNGLLAAGGNLTPMRLLDAYSRGIFPWYSAGDPILWWSPDPRMVLFPAEFRISHSLRKVLRSRVFEIRSDTAFEAVMRRCASPRPGQDGTWIHEEMIAAYVELHRMGHAHSVETWLQGELVGGLYGVAIGRMFFGESMFSRHSNASKVALAHLAAQLLRWNFGMIDCQMNTAHLESLGAREVSRAEFRGRLQELVNYPDTDSPWHLDHHEFIA
jgi:leucyl/phenylalanyl-tRNA--protein transferase